MVNEIYHDGRGHKAARPVTTREAYFAIRNAELNVERFAAARAGDKKAKMKLAQFNYNDILPDGVLKGCCHPASTFAHDIDCTTPEEQQATVARLLEKKDEIGLLEVSGSANYGVHAVCRRERGKTILECQVRVAQLTGTEMDTSAHDLQRVMFTGPATDDNLFYLDDAIFAEPMGLEESQQEYAALKERERNGWEEVPDGARKAEKHYMQKAPQTHPLKPQTHPLPLPKGGGYQEAKREAHPLKPQTHPLPLQKGGEDQEPNESPQELPSLGEGMGVGSTPPFGRGSGVGVRGRGVAFGSVPYSAIISEWFRRNGGEPREGERNVKLYRLAVNLRAICDNKREVLMGVMPRFGLSEQELKSIVDSACKEPTKGSRIMDEIVRELEVFYATSEEGEEEAEADSSCEGGSSDTSFISSLRRTLPIGLRESLVGVPESMFIPVLCGVLPLAAAYADQVVVKYCDGNFQRLGLMSIIRGDQASGKSVVKNAVDVWKRQFDEEDAVARKREEEWKERKKGRKANEKAPEDPHVLIRMVPVTVSCSTLLKRFKNSNGHALYSFGEELDTLRKTNGAGSWSSKYDIYRLSFDNGEWGQDYNSDVAESGVVKVAYNWTMLGTNGALQKCFRSDNIENGLSSRVLVAEMPDASFAKMPKFGHRSEEDEARIQEAVTKLRSYSGYIDTPRLRKAIEQWVEKKRVEAAKDIDHVKDTYRKRAAVIGFRCGVVHHLLKNKENTQTPQTHPLPLPKGGGYQKPNVSPLALPSLGEGMGVGSSPSLEGMGVGSSPSLEGMGVGVRGAEHPSSIRFALQMAEYCLQQQIAAFGEALETQYVEARSVCQRYGVNHSVFDRLPGTFTMDDLRALKRGSCGESALRNIVTRWRRDGWIEKKDNRYWAKVPHLPHLPHATLR